jgi:hypothetical protein
MAGVVDPDDLDAAAGDVDLVDAARRLHEAPVGGERLVEHLEQQRSVDAVMADENDGVAVVMFERVSQRVGGSRHEVLQRLAARKPDELGVASHASNSCGFSVRASS